jgi:hypothetical protein
MASVVLVRLWPVAATVAAFTFAFADGWWSVVTGGYGASRPVLDLVYASACAGHMLYLRSALSRQRDYAFAYSAPAVEGAAPAIQTRWRETVAAGAIVGGVLVIGPLVFLLVVLEKGDDWEAIAGGWPLLASCGIAVGAIVGWRRERQRLRALRIPGATLLVDACIGMKRMVFLYAQNVDQPFAHFKASRPTETSLSAAAIGDVFTGHLYGDLRAGGFAGFTGDDETFIPRAPLAGPDGGDNPRHIRDAPAPDATAEAMVRSGALKRTITRYVVTPHDITCTRIAGHGPATGDRLSLDAVCQVRLVDIDDSHLLRVESDPVTYVIPRSAYADDFRFLLGDRLREHHRQDAVADDRTRIHLGLVGGGLRTVTRPAVPPVERPIAGNPDSRPPQDTTAT